MNPAKKHPNALVSLVSSLGLGSGAVTVCQHWFGWKLSTQDGVYVAGGLATVALFVGHNGLVGTWETAKRLVLHGTGGQKTKKGKKKP